jgi:diguanylate cyclase (GGDEF)-like protein
MQLRHITQRGAGAENVRGGGMRAPLLRRGPDAPAILASIGGLAYTWDIGSDRLDWGPNAAEVLGEIALAGLDTGLSFSERLAPESPGSRYDSVMKSTRTDEGAGVVYQTVYALTPSSGIGTQDAIWVEDTGRWFAGTDGRPERAHGVLRVIKEENASARRQDRGLQFDPVDGVSGRTHLNEQLQNFMTPGQITRSPFALMLIAIENLFALNRAYGYEAGDAVIAGLGRLLRANVRSGDMVARHAGNKFALALENCDAAEAQSAALRLIDVVRATPFETSVGAVPATIRIGSVIAPRDGRTPHALILHAEEALDVARRVVGRRIFAYTASLAREDSRIRALRVADNVISALNEDRVALAFQPVVRADTGAVAFHEALLRLRLPDGTISATADIVPVAEKAGLMQAIDLRVMSLALDRLTATPDLQVSINCSLASMLDPQWADGLGAAIARHPDIAGRLIVEVTETGLVEDYDAMRAAILACKRLGVRVAMDDFGAGHTSFRNLRDLDFDIVKIDGAFVRNIAASADDRFFVKTLIGLARHLSLEVVAEWVQDAETASILREMGVNYLQGVFFGEAGAR